MRRPLETHDAPHPGGSAVQILWAVLGLLFLGLGLVGILVPLLPTTPFLLLAAFCLARGSHRLHRWLTEHPRLGPPLEQWRKHRAISGPAKRNAVIAITAVPSVTFMIGAPLHVVCLQCLVLALPAAFILTRPPPPDDDAARMPCRPPNRRSAAWWVQKSRGPSRSTNE